MAGEQFARACYFPGHGSGKARGEVIKKICRVEIAVSTLPLAERDVYIDTGSLYHTTIIARSRMGGFGLVEIVPVPVGRFKGGERIARGKRCLAGFLIVVRDQRFEKEKVCLNYVAMVGAARRVDRVIRLCEACGHDFKMLPSLFHHKNPPGSFGHSVRLYGRQESPRMQDRSSARASGNYRPVSGILPRQFGNLSKDNKKNRE
jgi:hypothetical protein